MIDAAMKSPRLLAASLAAVVLAAFVFGGWPGLDLTVARIFSTADDHFVGDVALGRAVRHVFEAIPIIVMGGMTLLYVCRRIGGARIWSPTGVGLLMMASSLALGPGLLVNVILKDHSHRPRPVQVDTLGGTMAFRPFYAWDGACERNCSFVSGEGAAAFWTVAPALLVAEPYVPAAVAAALTFGGATGLLRMAFGGHFLSDTVFAALLTWLVIVLCWRASAALVRARH